MQRDSRPVTAGSGLEAIAVILRKTSFEVLAPVPISWRHVTGTAGTEFNR